MQAVYKHAGPAHPGLCLASCLSIARWLRSCPPLGTTFPCSSGKKCLAQNLDAAGLLDAELTYCWKAALETLAVVKSTENMPLFVCLAKLLPLLEGWDTGALPTAQAKVLTSVGLRDRPDHLLQPEHKTSIIQCVEFFVDARVV